MANPGVSIVVPCRNGGEFLDGLLANLALQTFRDFEVIIVDDESTDAATRLKLASLRGVRIIHQYRRYTGGARNNGILQARADFILPLDCDDRLEPSFLEETVPLLHSAPSNVAFIFTHMRLTHAVEGMLTRHFDPFDQLFLNQLPYCMLLRRSAWKKVGGYDERMRDGCEDWEFNIRLVEAGFRGLEVSKPLFIYRVSPNGLLMRRTMRMHGTIWRYIRNRHSDLYGICRLGSLAAERAPKRKMSIMTAAALLAAAKLMPERWFNECYFFLFHFNRSHRLFRGKLDSTSAHFTVERDLHS